MHIYELLLFKWIFTHLIYDRNLGNSDLVDGEWLRPDTSVVAKV